MKDKIEERTGYIVYVELTLDIEGEREEALAKAEKIIYEKLRDDTATVIDTDIMGSWIKKRKNGNRDL